MNENQEKKLPEEENSAEPLTKKIAKFSAFIYLGLAITVVIVATVGIFSISYDFEQSLPEISVPDLQFSTDISLPDTDITSDISESPVINEQSNVGADISEPEQRVMFYRPVSGETTKPYSMDALVFSQTMGDYRVHSGIDLAADVGANVLAFTDGVIASIVDDYFYGTTVAITHDGGMVSYYMNLAPELAENIAVGSEVLAGQTIGYVGTTARCESADKPHLHFELRLDKELLDPETEMPQ